MKKTLILATVILASMSGMTMPTRGMLSARDIEFLLDEFPENPTARDYIQNGLVHMWDGIENAGWGVHDEHSPIWVDLVGGSNATLTQYGFFTENCLTNIMGTSQSKAHAASLSKDPSYAYVEAVVEVKTGAMDLANLCSFSNPSGVFYNRVSGKHYLFPRGISQGNGGRINLNEITCFSAGRYGTDAIYINGIDVSQSGISHYNSTPSYGFLGVQRMKGAIYCCRLYNRTLTEKEVLYNYLIDQMRFNLQ